MHPGKSTKPRRPSRPFNAVEHLRSEAEVAAYLKAMLQDADPRAVSVALRTVADFMGSKTLRTDGGRARFGSLSRSSSKRIALFARIP